MNAPTTQLVILSLVVWILSKFGNQRGWKIFCPWNSFSKGFLEHLPPLKSLLKNLGLIFDFICPGFEEWLITKISIKAQVGAFLNKFSRLNVELKIVETFCPCFWISSYIHPTEYKFTQPNFTDVHSEHNLPSSSSIIPNN